MTPMKRIKNNPKTTILAAVLGTAETVALSGVIPPPYGQIVSLAVPLVATIALLFAQD